MHGCLEEVCPSAHKLNHIIKLGICILCKSCCNRVLYLRHLGYKSLKFVVPRWISKTTLRAGYSIPRMYTGCPGQPQFYIARDRLEFLVELNLFGSQIANLLGVSERTVQRRMAQFQLFVRNQYSYIKGNRLDRLIRIISQRYPNYGYRMVQAHLRSSGVRMPESQVRALLERVDPVGVAGRWSQHRCVLRRVYSVPYPIMLCGI